jgi:bis(5'-nucleosidyl)-tetraphosphatase
MSNTIDKSVGAVLISNDWDKVLIIRSEHHYGFPKGHAENNETEILTMQREVKEEIGLELKNNKILGRSQITYPIYQKNITRIIVCYILKYNDTLPIILQTTEIDEAKWVYWKDALELLKDSKQYLILLEAIKLVIIKKFRLNNLFSRIKPYDKIIIEPNYFSINIRINKKYIKYYLGYDILIYLFVNSYNLNNIKIYKLKPINKLYYTNNYNINVNNLLEKYNGLLFNNETISFGIIWNLNIIQKIFLN